MVPSVQKAEMYAAVVHGNKVYAEEIPYHYHLKMVVDVLRRFGFEEPAMLCAGWLHDSIEDCGISYNDIKKRFGNDVAELVYLVTNELGRNRKERCEKTYPKIRGNERATALKLADRIANVEYSSANGGLRDMYVKEYAGFREGIHQGIYEDHRIKLLWDHLTRLLS